MERRRLARKAEGASAPAAAPALAQEVLHTPGRLLDAGTRAYFEPRFGCDFRNVRIHHDARADAAARAVNAVAYTVGSDIVFRHGALATNTATGRRLLAHELAHVVQQSGGTASDAASGPLTVGATDDRLEREADQLADAIVRHEAISPGGSSPSGKGDRVLRRSPRGSAHPSQQLPECPAPGRGRTAFMDLNCVLTSSENHGPDCRFTTAHTELLEKARERAIHWVRLSLEVMRYGAEGRQAALQQAQLTFGTAAPSFAVLERQAILALAALHDSSVRLVGTTCGYRLCSEPPFIKAQTVDKHHVRLCPVVFYDATVDSLAQTLLHEWMHVTGQPPDSSDPLNYCDSSDCTADCNDRLTADSWKQFFYCLGGGLRPPPDFKREIIRSAGGLR